MNSNKLVKAIQILVREELKVILPKLIKESVRKEIGRVLNEGNINSSADVSNTKEYVTEKRTNGDISEHTKGGQKSFLDEDVVLEDPLKKVKQYSKNPALNEVLSQTQPFNSKERNSEEGFRTMEFDQKDVHTVAQRKIADDGGNTHQERTGLGMKTGNEQLDKAFNRDYSGLIKAMGKKGK